MQFVWRNPNLRFEIYQSVNMADKQIGALWSQTYTKDTSMMHESNTVIPVCIHMYVPWTI